MKKPFIISTFTAVSLSVTQCNASMKSNPWNAHSCCKCRPKLFLPSKLGTSPSPVTAQQCLSFSVSLPFSPLFVFLSAFVLLPGLSWSQLPLSALYSSRSGWGGWQRVLLKGEKRDGGNVCIISPDEHVSEQPMGGLWSSKSDHFALKSADTVFSSHPENDLIYSSQLVIATVDSCLRF